MNGFYLFPCKILERAERAMVEWKSEKGEKIFGFSCLWDLIKNFNTEIWTTVILWTLSMNSEQKNIETLKEI